MQPFHLHNEHKYQYAFYKHENLDNELRQYHFDCQTINLVGEVEI